MIDKGNTRYPPTEQAWLAYRKDRRDVFETTFHRTLVEHGFGPLVEEMGLYRTLVWFNASTTIEGTTAAAWKEMLTPVSSNNMAITTAGASEAQPMTAERAYASGMILQGVVMEIYSHDKRIYRPDNLLVDTLMGVGFKANFPMAVFRRFERQIYAFELPRRTSAGVFNVRNIMAVVMDIRAEAVEEGPRSLAILGDFGPAMGYLPIAVFDLTGEFVLPTTMSYQADRTPFVGSSDYQATASKMVEAEISAMKAEAMAMAAATHNPTVDLVQLVLNLILYIEGEDDITTIVRAARKNLDKKPAAEAMRLRELQEPHVFGFGAKWGRAVQHWISERDEQHRNSGGSGGGTGGWSVCPHIREAHQHLYWTGPGRTIPVVKFLMPILVKGGGTGDSPGDSPTIHSVH